MPATRWEQVKKGSFITILLLLIILPILFMSPAGPAMLKWYVFKENSIDEPVKPWATEWMYKLGRYYSITLDDKSAQETYKTIFKYYHKRDVTKIAKDDKYVGMALFHDAKILADTSHDQWAARRYKQFLIHFGKNPDIPDEYKNMAKTRVRGW